MVFSALVRLSWAVERIDDDMMMNDLISLERKCLFNFMTCQFSLVPKVFYFTFFSLFDISIQVVETGLVCNSTSRTLPQPHSSPNVYFGAKFCHKHFCAVRARLINHSWFINIEKSANARHQKCGSFIWYIKKRDCENRVTHSMGNDYFWLLSLNFIRSGIMAKIVQFYFASTFNCRLNGLEMKCFILWLEAFKFIIEKYIGRE